MAQIGSENGSHTPRLFNSRLETGLRAVILLEASYPDAVDLASLVWLDHLVVHTGDLGGPQSLHPAVPGRNGELLVRRRLIEDAIALMRQLHLVDLVADADGISYRASDEAPAVLDLLDAKYIGELKICAKWVVTHIGTRNPAVMAKLRNPDVDRWLIEFQDGVSGGNEDV